MYGSWNSLNKSLCNLILQYFMTLSCRHKELIFNINEVLSFWNHVNICFMNGGLALCLFTANGPFWDGSKNLTIIISKLYLNRQFIFWRFLNRFSHFSCFSRLGLIKTLYSSKYLHKFAFFFYILLILKIKILLIKIVSIIWVIFLLLILFIRDWNLTYFFSQSKLSHRRRQRYSIVPFETLIGSRLLFLTFTLILIWCVSINFFFSTF